jgi:Vacuolar protein sorting-associated protein 62
MVSWGENQFTQIDEDAFYNDDDSSWQQARFDNKLAPDAFENDTNLLSQIPQYVVDYAPLVHLYSGEEYWPCDIREHLYHITPQLNYTPVLPSWRHPRLDNLDALNRWEYGKHMFLTSDDNVEDHPEWLMGEKNIPASTTPSSQRSEHDFSAQVGAQKTQGGRSDAPAVLVVVNKGNGIVDAFWFFFYSFNLGNMVVLRFGNHVGDWEHSVVRFHNGKPKAVFVSEHFFGQAYSYRAVEKIGKRPVIYSAIGTHAMYATPGTHSYILPWGLLHDRTDKGPLWDPALNSLMYTYDVRNYTLRSSNITPKAPTEWFHFAGRWGDKQYPLSDSRQYLFAGNYHYVSGPLGPKFKNLGRRKICQGGESERCIIKNWLGGSRLRRVERPFEEEELSEEERVRLAT